MPIGWSCWEARYAAVGQNQWYHLGVGAPPILVYFSWDWDVHWGLTGVLTHGHVCPLDVVSPFSLGARPVINFIGADQWPREIEE